MEIPSPLQLLTVWEQGVNQSSPEQALLLLSATLPDALPDALARQSIGRRNRLLLAARTTLWLRFSRRCRVAPRVAKDSN